MRTVRGKTIAPGLANGCAVVLLESVSTYSNLPRADKETEILRLQRAFQSAKADLEVLQDHVHQAFGASEAEIFAAHQLLLGDLALRNDIAARINSETIRAEEAIAASVDEFAKRMSRAHDPYLREREMDVRDIGNRLIRHASGHPSSRFSTLQANSIIVAKELLPSDLVELDSKQLSGVVTERCGENSHVAILARALGIPALTGIASVNEKVFNGQRVLVNGYSGELIIEPTTSVLKQFAKKHRRYEKFRIAQRAEDHLPCQTKDGTEILLLANLARPNEADLSISSSLAGVGLLRTEFLFLDHSDPPSIEEQVKLYTGVAQRFAGRDICIRTLDLGGDKYPLFLKHSLEHNPNMGVRGLRFSLGSGLSLFETQLDALLKVSVHYRVSILLPMVLGVDDLLEAKEIIAQRARELGLTVPPIGVLVETPAAVFLIDEIVEQADFINLGTNDLTQFVLASDRNAVHAQNDHSVLHPAVLRAVKIVSSAAQLKSKPVTVCGEAAGTPEVAALMVGLGIRRLSMSPSLSAPVKLELRNYSLELLESLAAEAIKASSIIEVKKIVAMLVSGRSPSKL